MLRRGIDGIQLQRLFSGIDDVVPCSCGNQHGAACRDGLTNGQTVSAEAHSNERVTAFDNKHLIQMAVLFQPDAFSDGNAHQCELQMLTGPYGRPKRRILFCGRRQRNDGRGRPAVRQDRAKSRERQVVSLQKNHSFHRCFYSMINRTKRFCLARQKRRILHKNVCLCQAS